MKVCILFKILFLVQIFVTPIFCAQAFFGERIRDVIVTLAKNERESIQVAMYTLTDPVVAAALINAHKRGVHVECVVDGFTNRIKAGQGYCLRKNGIMARKYISIARTDLMHNKYFIFGETKLYKTKQRLPCILTGSYNCTYNATFRNYENMVMLLDEKTIKKYKRNFGTIKKVSEIIPLHLARKQSRD